MLRDRTLLRKLVAIALCVELLEYERKCEEMVARIDAEDRPNIDDIRRGLDLS